LELAKNSSEQTRLRDALKELKRDEWSSSDVLRKILQEGLRIHPVAASVVARQTGRDFVTSRDAFYLPKGSVVFLPVYLLHRNHHSFDDADQFRPSRWDDPSDAMKDGFMPFAAGRHNCVGQALANAELHCIIARIIQDYEFTIHEEGEAENYLVLKPVGLRMKARRMKSLSAVG
jgi:cytochrome P450